MTNEKQPGSVILADLLDALPNWDDGEISLSDWFGRAGVKHDIDASDLEMLITLLNAFDVISMLRLPDLSDTRIRIRSEIAGYFLRSLSKYLKEDRKVLSNWERSGVDQGPFSINDFLSGPQFLYAMEFCRSQDNEGVAPIRETNVVKAIIKAKVRGKKEPVFLTQFDERTKKYQLIGGHIRKTDQDHEDSVHRELEEELNRDNFVAVLNYELRYLDSVEARELSLTFGVNTQYKLLYYQPVFETNQLKLGPNDRWITLSELIAGKTKRGIEINEPAIIELNQKLPGGLIGLNLSLEEIQKVPIKKWIKDNAGVVGIIITIVGIVLSIVFFVLGGL